ncbi:hypothetical protein Tco_0889383 [Tanacetum coccineum]
MSLDEELAHKLHKEEQARFNAEQEAKFNVEQEELLASETTEDEDNPPVADIDWDDVQAQSQADEDLAQKLLKEERVGNHTEAYQIFDDMLKKFDRDDLDKLWSLVKERFSLTDLVDDKERTLWVELKMLFEPDTDDIL